MGIQKKFVLLLVSVFTIYTLTAMFLLREVVGRAFETLENDLAQKDFVRAQEAIESDLAVLLALSAD